jgi:Fibronectin type III domain
MTMRKTFGHVQSGVVCPFCYKRIDPSQLWYQCLGRGNGTCKKAVDPERERLTKSRLETYPSFAPPDGMTRNAPCPACGGSPNLRACPACHTALPVHFDESDVAIFGLVGSRGSGKTVLMTVLAKELRDEIGKRFQASISLATENPDGLAGEDDYGANREDALFRERTLPNPTALVGEGRDHSASLLLRWWQEGRGLFGLRTTTRSTMLAFVDSAGEQASSLTAAFTLEYLEACGGLIVLLDPFALPGARATLSLPPKAINVDDRRPLKVVETITEKLRVELGLRMREKIPIPTAVVFTKMDAFFPLLDRSSPLMAKAPASNAYDDEDGQRVHEQMRSLLHRWGGQDIDAQINGHYRDYRYFAVSALGAEPDYPRYEVDPGGVRPHRVEDPVLWLLSKKGTVRAVTAGSRTSLRTRPPPVRLPAILRSRRGAPLISVAAAVVVVVAGFGLLLAAHPWVHPPVLRPIGLAVGSTGTGSLSIDWSGPPTGPAPDKYEILRDGHQVSTVPGATTRYIDKGLAPATAYTYQVIAVRGGKVSPASAALSARTATPPVSAGVLDWKGTVDYTIGDLSNIDWSGANTWTDSWTFTPACQHTSCDIKLSGAFDSYDFAATLDPSSTPGTYTGTAPLNDFWTCDSDDLDSTLTITVTVTGAGVVDKQWVAKSFKGTVDAAVNASETGDCGSGTAAAQVHSA